MSGLKRLEDFTLADLEAVRLVLRGDSVIDWHRLNFRDRGEIDEFLLSQELRPEVAGPALGNLLGEVASGAVRPPPIRSLPLASAQEAHELLEGRRVIGKLVLDPWS